MKKALLLVVALLVVAAPREALSAAETSLLPQRAPHDFDADGKSDILWRNLDGSDYLWLMGGVTVRPESGPVPGASADWKVAGVGDFDGDGRADILWRNTDGSDYLWLMDGASVKAGSGPVAGASIDWEVAGVGDFDGDGKADILWRNANGSNYLWLMDATSVKAGSGPVAGASVDWEVAGVGDFDGDGKADILWRNANGSNYLWLMDATSVKVGSGAVAGASSDWQVAGVGDFDGDGKTDILWRNTDGSDYLWLMDATSVKAGSGPVPGASTDWQVADVGDFDADGRADLLWRNTDGAIYVWLMDALSVKAGSGAVAGLAASWKVAPDRLPTWWKPLAGASWDWQLAVPITYGASVEVYDIDMFQNTATEVAHLHADGRKVICYVDLGSWENWRPDASLFPASVRGAIYKGFKDENWLDIRRIDVLAPIMGARLDQAKAMGCDGVEPDNMDGYDTTAHESSGFPLTYQDQLNYNRWIARQVHRRGMAVGLKNDIHQTDVLVKDVDFAVSEECFQYGECNFFVSFISAGKPVFECEYGLALTAFCPQANAMNFSSIKKHNALDSYRQACR